MTLSGVQCNIPRITFNKLYYLKKKKKMYIKQYLHLFFFFRTTGTFYIINYITYFNYYKKNIRTCQFQDFLNKVIVTYV